MMQLLVFRKDELRESFNIDLDNSDELKRYIDLRIDLLLRD